MHYTSFIAIIIFVCTIVIATSVVFSAIVFAASSLRLLSSSIVTTGANQQSIHRYHRMASLSPLLLSSLSTLICVRCRALVLLSLMPLFPLPYEHGNYHFHCPHLIITTTLFPIITAGLAKTHDRHYCCLLRGVISKCCCGRLSTHCCHFINMAMGVIAVIIWSSPLVIAIILTTAIVVVTTAHYR